MRMLEDRAEALARDTQQRVVAELGQAWRDRMPGIRVEQEDGRLVLSGRGLVRRWIGDTALRFAATRVR